MINIAFCGNQNVLALGSVAIVSLIQHTNSNNLYNVYFLHAPDCDKSDLNKLQSLSTSNVNVKLIDMSKYEDRLQKITTHRFGTPSLYRILLPEVFPNLDRIVYLDTDIMLRNDIAILHNMQFKSNDWLIAARKNLTIPSEVKYKLNNKCDFYNSGVLIINLNEWRNQNIQQKVLTEVSTNKYKTPDQSAINIICKNHIEEIPFSWNNTYVPYTNPNIVHFQMNAIKTLPDSNSYKQEWMQYKQLSPLKFSPDWWIDERAQMIKSKITIIILITICVIIIILFIYYKPFNTLSNNTQWFNTL